MKQLVGFLTPCIPDKHFTIDLSLSMKESGLDILELGIPFSDPVADGEVIEKASLKALKQSHFNMEDLFDISLEITPHIDTLWMGYMNPFYHKGMEYFLDKATKLKVSGMIIPDLPYEEGLRYKTLFQKYNKTLIDFIAPTTDKQRISKIVSDSSKFIYLVAYAGITGANKEENLDETISNIKEFCKTPIYIGFGVNEKTAKDRSKNVDGVIVGSAFIKVLLDDKYTKTNKIKIISKMVKNIKEQING